ncbi:MAG: hypothetical protein ABI832_20680 [bacterium]
MTHRVALLTCSALFLAASLSAAFADNSKGNSHSNQGHGSQSASHPSNAGKALETAKSHNTAKLANDAGQKPGNGGLVSELKGLNAVEANPNALANAAPGSQVGRIAVYRDAALVTNQAQSDFDAATAVLDGLPVPTRDLSTIDQDIQHLDPSQLDYDTRFAALQTERAQTVAYLAAKATADDAAIALGSAQTTEDTALLDASGGRQMTEEAIAYIRSVLNL